jgi:hypothetical protein
MPITTRPTSLTKTGVPLFTAITTLPMSSIVLKSPKPRT